MAQLTITAQERDLTKKPAHIRAEKLLPAEFYAEGKENQHLVFDYEDFRRLYRKAGKNSIVDVKMPAGGTEKVLIQEIQLDPIYDTIIHADLYGVKMKEKITTTIPLEFVGESNAVKNFGGIFVVQNGEIEVKCLPTDLVPTIEVDISGLEELGDSIHLEGINLPKGMEVTAEENLSIAMVMAPKVAEEETPVAEEGAEGEEGAAEAPAEEASE